MGLSRSSNPNPWRTAARTIDRIAQRNVGFALRPIPVEIFLEKIEALLVAVEIDAMAVDELLSGRHGRFRIGIAEMQRVVAAVVDGVNDRAGVEMARKNERLASKACRCPGWTGRWAWGISTGSAARPHRIRKTCRFIAQENRVSPCLPQPEGAS